jgi:hypothetical protein
MRRAAPNIELWLLLRSLTSKCSVACETSERNSAFGWAGENWFTSLQQKLMRFAEKMSNGPDVAETCVMNYTRKRRALCKITPATSGVHLTAVAVNNVTGTFLFFYCSFTVHFDKYKIILPTNALFIKNIKCYNVYLTPTCFGPSWTIIRKYTFVTRYSYNLFKISVKILR